MYALLKLYIIYKDCTTILQTSNLTHIISCVIFFIPVHLQFRYSEHIIQYQSLSHRINKQPNSHTPIIHPHSTHYNICVRNKINHASNLPRTRKLQILRGDTTHRTILQLHLCHWSEWVGEIKSNGCHVLRTWRAIS